MGGFAGDGLPIARALASTVDHLITHPNVLNGAMLYWPTPNIWYVEGYGLDRVCGGEWGLRRVRQNRIGVILDGGIEPDLQLRHVHVMQAAQATLGLEILAWVVTEEPLGVSVSFSPTGASQGSVERPEVVLQAAVQLVDQGAEAIAVVARLPDDLEFQDYEQGRGVDPLAGVEAILSHLVVRELQIPCAHAPAFRIGPSPTPVHPRAAAEEIGFTFLPSVLAGLSYAPQFVDLRSADPRSVQQCRQRVDLSGDDIDVAIVPASAFGGPGILHLIQRERPPLVIAVEENRTVMSVYPEDLGLPALRVRSYLEAMGAIVAHRAGVNLKTVQGGI